MLISKFNLNKHYYCPERKFSIPNSVAVLNNGSRWQNENDQQTKLDELAMSAKE